MRGSSAFLGVAAVGAIAAGGVAEAKGGDLSISTAGSSERQPPKLEGGGEGLSTVAVTTDKLGNQLAAQADQQDADAKAERDRIAREAAKAKAEKERKVREAKAKAEKERLAKEKAEKERKAKAEKERKAREAEAKRLAKMWKLPTSNFRITAGYGQSGTNWSNLHTGLDFAAPTGTPAKAIHGGTVTQAGWSGSYGYRVVLTLDDGTEIWYCHLSSITKYSGKVASGEQVGRVGTSGNSTGPHLHVEVRPGGGDPVNPLPWLRAKGLTI
jgi:murein DD-endopeptidase MepM/ murein hydrolase activator NlpD